MHALARVPVVLVALLIAGASLATPPGALAQDAADVAATATVVSATAIAAQATVAAQETALAATPTPAGQPLTVVVTNDATSTPLDPAMVLALILVLLLVALFALSEIFRYLRDGREDYYKTFRELARKGVYAAPTMVGAVTPKLQPAAMIDQGGLQEAAPQADRFIVTGPSLLTVDEPGVFTVLVNGAPSVATQWRLTTPEGADVPAANATLSAASGSTTTFTGLKAGTYLLTATPPDFPTAITVVEPPPTDAVTPSLPFIGEGYGSIVGAILLLAVVVVLAAARAIDADVIGVLLGSIAGYLFGVGVSKATS